MAIGPGKYDAITRKVAEELNADGVVLIIWGGKQGSGLSALMTRRTLYKAVALLRNTADELEKDLAQAMRETITVAKETMQ